MTQSLVAYHRTVDLLIEGWLLEKQTGKSGSAKTAQAYLDTITSFRETLQRGGLDLDSEQTHTLTDVATIWAAIRSPTSKREGEIAPATYNQRLAIVSSFYTYCQEQAQSYGQELVNPIKAVKKPKVQAYAAAVPLSPEHVEQGLEQINRKTQQGLRDYAILAVALSTGRRASELVGLRGKDIKIAGRKDPRITLTFHCKGKKIMRDTLDIETSAVVLEYLHTEYGKHLLMLPADAPLWISYSKANKGQAIGIKTLSNICDDRFDTSKVHTLRHTFAVGMIRSNAPITDLAGRLGHTDITTTQIYTKELLGDDNPYGEKLTQRFGIRRKGK